MMLNGSLLTIGLAATAVSGAGYWLYVSAAQYEQSAGQLTYAQQCASCHGAKLEGQPNWMKRLPNGRLPAPPHNESGHTWHHSDKQLFTIVKFGLGAISPGYVSDMPSFDGMLTDAQIVEVLDYIESTWSERALKYQEARSLADP